MSPMCPGSIWCQRESSVLTLKNDLSQQDLEGGWCVWQSPALCWQPNRVQEEGIIRITHTHIYTNIHIACQHTNIHVQNAHTQSDMRKCVHAYLHRKKGKENISWLIFSTSNRAWRCGRCRVTVASTLWQSKTRLTTTKTDSKTDYVTCPSLLIRNLNIRINTWRSITQQGMTECNIDINPRKCY